MLLIANCSPQHLPEAELLLYEVAFVGFRSQRFANAVGTGTEKQSDTPPGANSKEFQELTEKQRGEKHLKLTRLPRLPCLSSFPARPRTDGQAHKMDFDPGFLRLLTGVRAFSFKQHASDNSFRVCEGRVQIRQPVMYSGPPRLWFYDAGYCKMLL